MGKFVFCLVLVVMMSTSCGKDVDVFIPNTQQAATGNINRLTAKLKQDIAGDIQYTVSCPCFGNVVFELDKDLVVSVPSGFVDLSQFPCTTGSFDLHVTVCDTKGEILIAGIPTISANELIASRIELNLRIMDGTHKLPLAHGKQFRILVNDPDPIERMELFYGDGDSWIEADQNRDTWDNVNTAEWNIPTDSTQTEFITGFGYGCFSDSTDWINVDAFYYIPKDLRTSVCLQLPEEFTNTNTSVFMVFRDHNSVVQLRGDAETKQFCEPYGASPIGFRVTFVAISEHGENNYLLATKQTTLTANMTETLVPVNTPYQEILTYLSTL